jgi:hypothetical protein
MITVATVTVGGVRTGETLCPPLDPGAIRVLVGWGSAVSGCGAPRRQVLGTVRIVHGLRGIGFASQRQINDYQGERTHDSW